MSEREEVRGGMGFGQRLMQTLVKWFIRVLILVIALSLLVVVFPKLGAIVHPKVGKAAHRAHDFIWVRVFDKAETTDVSVLPAEEDMAEAGTQAADAGGAAGGTTVVVTPVPEGGTTDEPAGEGISLKEITLKTIDVATEVTKRGEPLAVALVSTYKAAPSCFNLGFIVGSVGLYLAGKNRRQRLRESTDAAAKKVGSGIMSLVTDNPEFAFIFGGALIVLVAIAGGTSWFKNIVAGISTITPAMVAGVPLILALFIPRIDHPSNVNWTTNLGLAALTIGLFGIKVCLMAVGAIFEIGVSIAPKFVDPIALQMEVARTFAALGQPNQIAANRVRDAATWVLTFFTPSAYNSLAAVGVLLMAIGYAIYKGSD